ncbi:CrcB family protein [Paenibacillus sp.]|uniref:fluoride efflux transporter FluC n=1 Tax=Paenibacillus sp. TaxID=58172 RepID=UPI002D4AF008|nr:CrcB family protein [Paenibacillus sp.]HZG54928.1 CrcB family protein [Paenibacillus sp.]
MNAAALFAVACGGAIGAVLRAALLRRGRATFRMPYDTLAVNGAGSFLLGWAAAAGFAPPIAAAAFTAGFLGGFTTYSTFALETAQLAAAGRRRRAAAYVALTFTASIAAAAAGALVGGFALR